MKSYFVYILKCSDGSLYTGITNDLDHRLAMHKSGKGSKYVRAHLPIELVYREEFKTKSEALKREIEIKKMSRTQKLYMINGTNSPKQ